MGSAESDECRIDAIAQGWSVLSGVAPPERVEQALDAAEEYLIRDEESLIRLLTPPFDQTPHDPGYIKGYVPGVRENGGQYTHGVLWLVRAFAEAGRTDRAAALLAMLSPVHHTRNTDAADRYKTEPYVVAADVYSVAPHVGRGGWTWYTGSAGWTFRVALESILGFRIERGETLVLTPRIPSDWPGFSLRYRLPEGGGTVEIEVTRGETAATFDDGPVEVERGAVQVALPRDGASHRLRLTLPGSCYATLFSRPVLAMSVSASQAQPTPSAESSADRQSTHTFSGEITVPCRRGTSFTCQMATLTATPIGRCCSSSMGRASAATTSISSSDTGRRSWSHRGATCRSSSSPRRNGRIRGGIRTTSTRSSTMSWRATGWTRTAST